MAEIDTCVVLTRLLITSSGRCSITINLETIPPTSIMEPEALTELVDIATLQKTHSLSQTRSSERFASQSQHLL
jgi:hypothetical protein